MGAAERIIEAKMKDPSMGYAKTVKIAEGVKGKEKKKETRFERFARQVKMLAQGRRYKSKKEFKATGKRKELTTAEKRREKLSNMSIKELKKVRVKKE